MHEQPIYLIMAAFPICAEQGDSGSGFGRELEKPTVLLEEITQTVKGSVGKATMHVN